MTWPKFVDIVTVIWLVLFGCSFFTLPEVLATSIEWTCWVILSVFVADLVVAYLRVRNIPRFLKKHWLDILMVIPYFRIFRVLRLLRLFRFTRFAKVLKGMMRSERFYQTVKRTRKLWKRFLVRYVGLTLKLIH